MIVELAWYHAPQPFRDFRQRLMHAPRKGGLQAYGSFIRSSTPVIPAPLFISQRHHGIDPHGATSWYGAGSERNDGQQGHDAC